VIATHRDALVSRQNVHDGEPETECRAEGSGVTLITIEGIDGAGKTTLAHALQRELAARAAGEQAVELLREPGGVAVSERIRALVKDPALELLARTEVLLYAAARAQLVEERLRPLLREGAVVLLDRFVDSSLAYQGAGRALGIEQVRAINLFATGGLVPDRTLLLRIAPAAGRARRLQRELEHDGGSELDRLEREGEEFYAAIAAAYDELAREEPQRIRAIDAAGSPTQVLADALAALADLPLAHRPHG
jgi:dTMP kinase